MQYFRFFSFLVVAFYSMRKEKVSAEKKLMKNRTEVSFQFSNLSFSLFYCPHVLVFLYSRHMFVQAGQTSGKKKFSSLKLVLLSLALIEELEKVMLSSWSTGISHPRSHFFIPWIILLTVPTRHFLMNTIDNARW